MRATPRDAGWPSRASLRHPTLTVPDGVFSENARHDMSPRTCARHHERPMNATGSDKRVDDLHSPYDLAVAQVFGEDRLAPGDRGRLDDLRLPE